MNQRKQVRKLRGFLAQFDKKERKEWITSFATFGFCQLCKMILTENKPAPSRLKPTFEFEQKPKLSVKKSFKQEPEIKHLRPSAPIFFNENLDSSFETD